MKLEQDDVDKICRLVVDHDLDTQYVADRCDVGRRRVQQLAKEYRETDELPTIETPGRKPYAEYPADLVSRVLELQARHEQGAEAIAHILRQQDGITIDNNRVHAILQEAEKVTENPAKQGRQRPWVRFERDYSLVTVHLDWYQNDRGDWVVAVDGVDFTVHENEVHAVIGGNGAGKTTFSKLLTGLLKPTDGTVYVGDEPTDGRTARDIAETVGIALQNPDEQISEQTVTAELRFPLDRRRYERTGLLGLSKREKYDEAYIDTRVEEISEAVGLASEDMSADPVFLPHGLRRLVTMASAMAPDPDVLVLDEPAAGVDATAQTRVEETIRRFREAGKGIVLIDHDMDFVCEVADTITVLEDGSIAMQGPTHEVFAPENWEWLATRHLRPPKAARLAQRVGIEALTAEEYVDTFAPLLEVSG